MIGVLRGNYSKRLPRGSRVEIEAIKYVPGTIKKMAAVKAKVVNEWKRPRWLDIEWFEIIK